MRAIAAAIAIVFALFLSYYRNRAYGNNNPRAGYYKKNFKNAHFLRSFKSVYAYASNPFCFAASFLFLITITAATTAIAAAQMNEVHHHEPIV